MKYLHFFLVLICLFFNNNTGFAQTNGVLDESFAPVIESEKQNPVTTIVKQTDGKLLVGGSFSMANDRPNTNLVRYNPNGTIDSSFQTSISVRSPGIKATALQSDGKILVGGFLINPANGFPRSLIRLNSNGSLDTTFVGSINVNFASSVDSIIVQPDDKIVIAGSFVSVNGVARSNLARLNADGSLDNSFDYAAQSIDAMVLQSDGKIVISEVTENPETTMTYKISRLNPNGSPDISFTATTGTGFGFHAEALKLQADGKIVVGGYFTQINNSSRKALARLNTNGSVDEDFNPILSSLFDSLPSINAIDIDAGGKILIGGLFVAVNGAVLKNVARLNADGSTDGSFSNQIGADKIVYSVLFDEDGKMFIGGEFQNYGGERRFRFIKLNSNGNADNSFSSRITSLGSISKIIIQPDGKTLATGSFKYVDGKEYGSIVRLLPDGKIDPTFAASDQTLFDSYQIYDFELLPDGKIIVGGWLSILGSSTGKAVVRLNPNGTVDNTFIPIETGDNAAFVVKPQPNGQILVGGAFKRIGGVSRTGLARFNSDGTIDASFNPVITTPDFISIVDLAVRNDGKILIGGYFSVVNGAEKNNLALLNSDGTLDASFTANASSNVNSIKQMPDGNFLI
ncbi:MAG: hypothetical protein H0U50_10790, partial [Pyrinomonadaceae bacterium]|nr:hypothetical protein [Pyrinomonadaceae bacterium]